MFPSCEPIKVYNKVTPCTLSARFVSYKVTSGLQGPRSGVFVTLTVHILWTDPLSPYPGPLWDRLFSFVHDKKCCGNEGIEVCVCLLCVNPGVLKKNYCCTFGALASDSFSLLLDNSFAVFTSSCSIQQSDKIYHYQDHHLLQLY